MTTWSRPGVLFARAIRRIGGAVADAVDVVWRTVDFARPLYARGSEVPHCRRAGLVGAAAADELLLAGFRQLRAPDDAAFATSRAEARNLLEHLDRTGVLAEPVRYHTAPAAPDLEWRIRDIAGRRFEHATFSSPYAPDASVPGAARYAEHTGNEIAHVWMLRQSYSAPWIVCVHGAGMGDPIVDLVLFRAAALHREGFNVAIPVLPHHGPRGAGRFEIAFPSDDAAVNLHGASQAIADVRAVLAHIAARRESAILTGISLGGYVAAAVAALEPSLAGVIAGVPVVSLAELLRTHAPPRFAHHERFAELVADARALEVVTSPIHLGHPATPIRRIWAGRADRLVRPDQVERLAEHWGVDHPTWYSGGHLGFFAAPSVRRCIREALADTGFAPHRAERVVVAA